MTRMFFARRLRRAVPVMFLFPALLWAAPQDDTARVEVSNYFGDSVFFDHPILFVPFPGEDSAALVVQLFGAMIRMERQQGEWVRSVFDSVAVGRSNSTNNNDAGLLGFAFHPDYAENGKYFLYYVADHSVDPYPGVILLEERLADSTRSRGAEEPGRILLRLDKPYQWHNGGTLHFGDDGLLYTAIGDGGSSNDPGGRSQNPAVLFGKMLRIDVDAPDAFPEDSTRNYAIPEDNPFVDSAGWLPEIWAYGLRSPWQWSFHPVTGDIWMGDVGQGTHEELTLVPRGGNLGWDLWEGLLCHAPPCPEEDIVRPLVNFSRTDALSITGGVFFTSDTAHAMDGAYIFGDYGRGTVWALRPEADSVRYAAVAEIPSVVSFARDAAGTVLVTSLQSGYWHTSPVWNGTGAVYALEFPDEDLTPVARPPRRRPVATLSQARVLAHPERYEILGLDGRRIRGRPSGAIFVREIGSNRAPVLMTVFE